MLIDAISLQLNEIAEIHKDDDVNLIISNHEIIKSSVVRLPLINTIIHHKILLISSSFTSLLP